MSMTKRRILDLAADAALRAVSYWGEENANDPDETTLENLRGAIAEYDEIKRLYLECEPFEDFEI